jgi:hypothetical protein
VEGLILIDRPLRCVGRPPEPAQTEAGAADEFLRDMVRKNSTRRRVADDKSNTLLFIK